MGKKVSKRTLTKAEEEVMQYLWQLGEARVKEVVACYPTPRPAYNTVSTIVRILEKKGVVGHKGDSKPFVYYPLIDKDTYSRNVLQRLVENYFSGSYTQLVSFFTRKKDLTVQELEDLLKELKQEGHD